MSRIDVTVPAYGMTNNDSYLKEWLVEEGTAVQEGTALVCIETSKADTELEAPASGLVGPLLIPADTEVAPGTVLTWIESIPS